MEKLLRTGLYVVCLVAACNCSPTDPSRQIIESAAAFHPDALPGSSADLVLAGTRYPVALVKKQSGDHLRFELVSHGEPFEVEEYVSNEKSFAVSRAAEESYSPPLPLLQFPMTVGEEGWDWNGTMSTGGIYKRAKAHVASSSETLYFGGRSHHTVRIGVTILLSANPGKPPLKRQMTFWFEPESGIVKREFGAASVRQPSSS